MNVFVKVGEFRDDTDHANRLSRVDYCACHKSELPNWLERAEKVLSEIEHQGCKRAKPEDLESRSRAVAFLRERIESVKKL